MYKEIIENKGGGTISEMGIGFSFHTTYTPKISHSYSLKKIQSVAVK